MKFVCENCKAKYQIGDDKVAGKTLRMKCRRCGHLIQVSAAVTESSVSKANPAMPPSASAEGSSRMTPAPPPRPGALSATSVSPTPSPVATNGSILGDPREEDGATVVRESPLFNRGGTPIMRNGAPPAPPARPAPRIVPPGRPSSPSMKPVAPPARPSPPSSTPLSSSGMATASSDTRVSALPASSASLPAPATSTSTPPRNGSGLAGGFARAMAEAPVAPSSAAGLPSEDWYVGIGGVPLGPVRVSVIREKAQAGVLDADSLVWREGFDEWIALRTIPGLLEIVEEARSSRPSRLSSPLVQGAFQSIAAPVSTPPTTDLRTPIASDGNTVRIELPPAPTPAISVPFSLVTPSTRPGETPRPRPTDDVASAVIVVPTAASPLAVADPFAAPVVAAPPASSPVAPAPVVTETVAPERKRRTSPVVWGFLAMCTAFGGVAAWALLFRKPAEIVYIEKTSTVAVVDNGGAPPPPPPELNDTAAPGNTTEPDSTATPRNGSAGAGVAGVKTSKTAEPVETAPIDTSGFKVGSTPGPTSDPNKGGTGTGQRSQGELEGVVNRNKPGTRRCWDKAMESAPSSAPKSVKVSVSFTVTASGSVSGASASGGDSYPGLSSCLVSRVSAWQFPPADGTNAVTVPFGFNRQ